jgi:exopolysaccharide production protein ExoZ
MFFYVSFGLLLAVLRKRPLVVSVLIALFASLVVVGAFLNSNTAIARTYTSPLLFEFLAGVIAAYLLLYLKLRPVNPVIPWALMAGGWAALIHVGVFNGNIAWAIGAVLAIVFAAAALDQANPSRSVRIFKLLGDASYSIYLIHIFVVGALKHVILQLGPISVIQPTIFISALSLTPPVQCRTAHPPA